MTIAFDRNTNQVRLSNQQSSRIVAASQLSALAAVNGWGDVESLLSAAKQNPGIEIPVDNKSFARGLHTRNYGRFAR